MKVDEQKIYSQEKSAPQQREKDVCRHRRNGVDHLSIGALDMGYTYEYPRPGVTTDMVAFAKNSEGVLHILLIERGHNPWKGMWALPGGFLEMDEELEACAVRECVEETGISIDPSAITQVGCFGGVDRDPRFRLLTVAFTVLLDHLPSPKGGDDAADARWWPVSDIPDLITDHPQIVKAALKIHS